MKTLGLLSTGEQSFEVLRREKRIYVDKTALIYALIFTTANKFCFLAHPRRFGKSLLISTLKALFLGQKELFKGLYIEDKIEWEEFPVIHLDFSNMGFRSMGLENAISQRLNEIAKQYNVNLEKTGNDNLFQELVQKLYEKTGKQVVVLIDEYDKPITDVLEVGENQKTHEHRDILRTFYSTVKGSSPYIRFFFLTGIARFSKVSLFSELNHLTDLTFEKDYHDLLGYTQAEIEKYFKPHLEAVAEDMGVSFDEVLQKLKLWYNGYSWNGRSRVYNPFSILRFLAAKEFRNFWFDSGTPKFLIALMKGKLIYDISGITVSSEETENFDIDNLGLETLLFQTGYLTIKEIDMVGRWLLVYPNKEVEDSMLRYILAAFAGQSNSSAIALDIVIGVQKHNFDMVFKAVNTLFASIPHQIFDQHQEKYFHSILFLSFKLCGFYIQSEVSVSTGRIDAVMTYENRVYIFEFKLNSSSEIALKQIEDKKYYAAYENQGKKIFLIGINFSGAKKEIENWDVQEV